MNLHRFKALSFDCYGTLIDWETGMLEALGPLAARAGRPLTRDQILQAHAREEARQQRQTPARLYRELLAVVYKRLGEAWGVTTTVDEAEAYGASVKDWPAFPDSAEALAYLKPHYRLIILSNIDNRSFEHSNRKLGVAFDAVYTAEDIGSYKPDDRNFAYLLEHAGDLGLRPGDLLHTAESLFHDHVPAKRHGLATCWIHRRHAQGGFGATQAPEETPAVDFRFTSLAELAAAHRASSGA